MNKTQLTTIKINIHKKYAIKLNNINNKQTSQPAREQPRQIHTHPIQASHKPATRDTRKEEGGKPGIRSRKTQNAVSGRPNAF